MGRLKTINSHLRYQVQKKGITIYSSNSLKGCCTYIYNKFTDLYNKIDRKEVRLIDTITGLEMKFNN